MTQPIEINLDAIAHGGEAIGRHAGKAIFVPYAIPGERVRIEIIEERDRWARARLLEVLEPSPDRVAPPCPYFGPEACGGCQWQHIAYPRQAELKQQIVADQLRRLGRIANPPVADIVALADPAADAATAAAGAAAAVAFQEYGYRNNVQFALTPEGRLGFRRAASHDVTAVEHCLLLDPRLDALHASLDVAWPELIGVDLRAGTEMDDTLILFEAGGDEAPELEIDLPTACALLTRRGLTPLIGEPWVFIEVLGRHYRVSAESFFQVNTIGAAALVEIVTAYADPQPGDILLDAYCGAGLFALALAELAGEVIGVESSPSACEDFEFNAGDQPNVSLHEGAVEQVLPALRSEGQRADIVVLDPPRVGAGPEVIRELAALGPRRMVYVSCDPATLARDAVYLAAAGYRLVEAQPVDLFPQTFHVETVALWERG
jgi:23S rRNA (uracil1939-C5)-methyltransferase